MASISEKQPASTPVKKRINFYWYLPPCEKCGGKHPPPPHPRSKDCEKIAARLKAKRSQRKQPDQTQPEADLATFSLDQAKKLDQRRREIWFFKAPWPKHYASWPEQIQRAYWLKRWHLLPPTTSIKEVKRRLRDGKFPRPYWVTYRHRPQWIDEDYTILEEAERPVTEALSVARSIAGKKGYNQLWRQRLKIHQIAASERQGVLDFDGIRFRLICHWRIENLIWDRKHPDIFNRLSQSARDDVIWLMDRSNVDPWMLHVMELTATTGEEKGRPWMLTANWKDRTVAHHMGISLKRYQELDRIVNVKPERASTHKSKVIERRRALDKIYQSQQRKHGNTSAATLQALLSEAGYSVHRETIRKDLQWMRDQGWIE